MDDLQIRRDLGAATDERSVVERAPGLSNMRTGLPRMYLAGKIGKHDWRQSIIPHIREGEFGRPIVCERFIYTGPFFVACDHGCAHGEATHGAARNPCTDHYGAPPRWTVPSLCREWIRNADVFFAWIDDPMAYGTVLEIGWAQMTRKPVYLAFKNEWFADQMWLAAGGPLTWSGVHTCPEEGLDKALSLGAIVR